MPPRPTRDALRQAGVDARAQLPIAAQADWRPAADRPDPVALLEEQAATRIPELVPVRYGRMAVSPFTFYRGAALPMAADLAAAPAQRDHRPAVRRRPPLELRAVRVAGAGPRLRHQRLRRDASWARSSGTSSDSRRASSSPGRSRGFDRANRRVTPCTGRSARTATRMADYAAMRAIDVYYDSVDASDDPRFRRQAGASDDRSRPSSRPPTTTRCTSCRS